MALAGAAAAAILVAALSTQLLPVVEPIERSVLRGLRSGLTFAWLVLVAYAAISAARGALSGSSTLAAQPAWRLALLLTALIVPRFRADLGMGTVGAFWLVLLLVCGASCARDLLGERALRPYWLASALFVAPWGLLPGVPAWP